MWVGRSGISLLYIVDLYEALIFLPVSRFLSNRLFILRKGLFASKQLGLNYGLNGFCINLDLQDNLLDLRLRNIQNFYGNTYEIDLI